MQRQAIQLESDIFSVPIVERETSDIYSNVDSTL